MPQTEPMDAQTLIAYLSLCDNQQAQNDLVARRDRSILVLAADRVCNNCGLSTRPCDQTCEIIKTIMGVNR